MKIYISLCLTFIFITISCQKLEDLNDNPNLPSVAAPQNLLPTIIRDVSETLTTESFLIANNAAQLSAKSLRTNVEAYQWSAFNIWTPLYSSLRNVKELEDLAILQENEGYEAVAVIIRCYIFSILTETYGDIPYTEALQVQAGISTPKYDTQESIYLNEGGILSELERANLILKGNTLPIDGDIMYDNDLSKWQRFCNSLYLRILLKLSDKIDIRTKITNLLGSSSNRIIASNRDNAVLNYLNIFPNQYPLTTLASGDFDAVKVSESLINQFSIQKDPRLHIYAREIDATINDNSVLTYEGLQNGVGCDNSGSRLGLIYYDYPGHPTTLIKAQSIWMTYSEVQFIIAELVQRNLLSGNVATNYKEGIRAAMESYEVDYSKSGWVDFEDFYQNAVGVSYQNGLSQIWEQKRVALWFHGMEPYLEVRRWLDYHNNDWSQFQFLEAPCNNQNSGLLPLRYEYPEEESTLNSDQYTIATSRMGGDDQNTKMWLLQ